jgi:hypothetical protein
MTGWKREIKIRGEKEENQSMMDPSKYAQGKALGS